MTKIDENKTRVDKRYQNLLQDGKQAKGRAEEGKLNSKCL